MKKNSFVYGNEERIFINTNLGCRANCKYCYLPSLGIAYGKDRVTADQVIERVNESGYFKEGKSGSIISIGCYSECMDEENIDETQKVVKYFLEKDNYVQLATKKEIKRSFFDSINNFVNVHTNLWIYVSIPVITDYAKLEEGTDSPYRRKKNFDLCKEYDIHCALYIKPFLNMYTEKDIEDYCDIAISYNIPVIVGKMLNTKGGDKVLVGEKRLFEDAQDEVNNFMMELGKSVEIYNHSIDCVR